MIFNVDKTFEHIYSFRRFDFMGFWVYFHSYNSQPTRLSQGAQKSHLQTCSAYHSALTSAPTSGRCIVHHDEHWLLYEQKHSCFYLQLIIVSCSCSLSSNTIRGISDLPMLNFVARIGTFQEVGKGDYRLKWLYKRIKFVSH